MFKTTRTRIIVLAIVGVVALAGAIYATTTLAGVGATTALAAAPTAQTATDQQLRARILDMLEDHMGLTGPDAEQWADRMIDRMQNLDPDLDLQDMIDWCTGYNADGTQGRGTGCCGTTNGYGPQGGGMMNGSGTQGYGTQGGGMMSGSGMMGR